MRRSIASVLSNTVSSSLNRLFRPLMMVLRLQSPMASQLQMKASISVFQQEGSCIPEGMYRAMRAERGSSRDLVAVVPGEWLEIRSWVLILNRRGWTDPINFGLEECPPLGWNRLEPHKRFYWYEQLKSIAASSNER